MGFNLAIILKFTAVKGISMTSFARICISRPHTTKPPWVHSIYVTALILHLTNLILIGSKKGCSIHTSRAQQQNSVINTREKLEQQCTQMMVFIFVFLFSESRVTETYFFRCNVPMRIKTQVWLIHHSKSFLQGLFKAPSDSHHFSNTFHWASNLQIHKHYTWNHVTYTINMQNSL